MHALPRSAGHTCHAGLRPPVLPCVLCRVAQQPAVRFGPARKKAIKVLSFSESPNVLLCFLRGSLPQCPNCRTAVTTIIDRQFPVENMLSKLARLLPEDDRSEWEQRTERAKTTTLPDLKPASTAAAAPSYSRPSVARTTQGKGSGLKLNSFFFYVRLTHDNFTRIGATGSVIISYPIMRSPNFSI